MIRNVKFLNQLALVALALCSSAVLGKAQNFYEGKFTLPFEVRWAGAVLPAGEYTIEMRSANAPYLLSLHGEGKDGKTAFLFAYGVETNSVSDKSNLTLVDAGGTQTITRLEAGQIGLTFDYPVPKSSMKGMGPAAGAAKATTSSVIPVASGYGSVSGR